MHAGGRLEEAGRAKKLAFLAFAIKEHPVQLRADLQRYFGLNLDRMGTDFGAFHAAGCIACLPTGSSLLTAIDRRASWSASDFLLHGIAQMLAGKELPFPWDDKVGGIDGVDTEAVPLDEFREWYENTQWKEVDGWQIQ